VFIVVDVLAAEVDGVVEGVGVAPLAKLPVPHGIFFPSG